MGKTLGIYNKEASLYHLGASLKHLGKRWFVFTRMDASGLTVMERLRELGYGE